MGTAVEDGNSSQQGKSVLVGTTEDVLVEDLVQGTLVMVEVGMEVVLVGKTLELEEREVVDPQLAVVLVGKTLEQLAAVLMGKTLLELE